MKKTSTILVASMFAFSSTALMAADTPSNPPPAQKQMNNVPDSTSSGNYLETQQDENGATKNNSDKNSSNKKGTKATNIEKGKSHNEKPDSGGVSVDSK